MPIGVLHTGSALVHRDDGWEILGGPDVRGVLPDTVGISG
jgi:hypothetical protein